MQTFSSSAIIVDRQSVRSSVLCGHLIESLVLHETLILIVRTSQSFSIKNAFGLFVGRACLLVAELLHFARHNIVFLCLIFLVEASHQLLRCHCLQFLGLTESCLLVADPLTLFVLLHDVLVALDHVLDHALDRELLVRRELRHSVVLLVKYGDIDMLVAYACYLVGFLQEATPPF